jgi:hypothetical protein
LNTDPKPWKLPTFTYAEVFKNFFRIEGYGDDELGFYTVYNEVFNTLAKEDMDHMDEQESDFEVMQLLETEPEFQI